MTEEKEIDTEIRNEIICEHQNTRVHTVECMDCGEILPNKSEYNEGIK